jgi:predicted  nucleic acid-binding Zn-ribbon protein
LAWGSFEKYRRGLGGRETLKFEELKKENTELKNRVESLEISNKSMMKRINQLALEKDDLRRKYKNAEYRLEMTKRNMRNNTEI